MQLITRRQLVIAALISCILYLPSCSKPPSTLIYKADNITLTAKESDISVPAQTISLSTSNEGNLNWAAETGAPWLVLSQSNGIATMKNVDIAVSANITGMSAGDYKGFIIITSPEAVNTTSKIPVTLHIDKKSAVTPIVGWKKFDADNLELSLPDSYVGGNPEDLSRIIENLKSKEEFSDIIKAVERAKSSYRFWAYDSNITNPKFMTNVNIIQGQTLSSLKLKTCIDAAVMQMPSQFNVVDTAIIDFEPYEAGKIVVDASISGVHIKAIEYLIKDSTNVYGITFATTAAEFDQKAPAFEQSFRSVKIKK